MAIKFAHNLDLWTRQGESLSGSKSSKKSTKPAVCDRSISIWQDSSFSQVFSRTNSGVSSSRPSSMHRSCTACSAYALEIERITFYRSATAFFDVRSAICAKCLSSGAPLKKNSTEPVCDSFFQSPRSFLARSVESV